MCSMYFQTVSSSFLACSITHTLHNSNVPQQTIMESCTPYNTFLASHCDDRDYQKFYRHKDEGEHRKQLDTLGRQIKEELPKHGHPK